MEHQTLGMIFEKSSTRTRVSFETGIYQLGGVGLFLSSSDIQLGRGEPMKDTARVISRMVDMVMIRTFEQSKLEEFAAVLKSACHQWSHRLLPPGATHDRLPHDDRIR